MSIDRLRGEYDRGDYAAAWALYQTDAQHQDPLWHWYGSLAAWRLGHFAASSWVIDRAIARRPRGELRVKCLHQLGMVSEKIGDQYRAKDAFEKCLRLLPKYPDLCKLLRGVALYNLAVVYGNLGLSQQALAQYIAAAQELRREGMRERLRMALQNIAWVACDLGDVPTAEVALDEADGLSTEEAARWHQRLGVAYLEVVREQYTAGMKRLEPILGEGATAPADVQSLGASILALAVLGLSNGRDEAMALAERMALQAIDLALMPPEDSRCWLVASRVRQKVALLKQANAETGA